MKGKQVILYFLCVNAAILLLSFTVNFAFSLGNVQEALAGIIPDYLYIWGFAAVVQILKKLFKGERENCKD